MSSLRGELPLVARDEELAVLRDSIEAAARGIGGAVCVIGAAGIGKTRLATEALVIARQAGFRCAWGAGWTEGGVPPLWPWHSVLTQLGQHDRALLDAEGDESEQERFAEFRAVADAVMAAAMQQPVLIVIDDAHAADLGALLLVRFVVRTCRATPVLIVITARDADSIDPVVSAALDDLARESTVLRPALLSVDGLHELLRRVGRSADESQVGEMLELTGGNPLFVGELLAGGMAGDELTPDSIRAIVHLRLQRLAPQALDILAVAAMLGPLARTSLVVAAVDIDAVDAAELIRSAQVAGVLAAVADERCRFTHGLLAEAVLAEIAPLDLARLHRRIADVLEVSDASAVQHVVATAHHRLAVASITRERVDVVDAVVACRRASTTLVAGLAYEAGSQLLARAVELHDHVGLSAPTDLLNDVARIDLAAGNLRQARSWFRRAADQAADPVDLAEAAVGLGGMWVHEHRTAADHASFMALLERALAGLVDHRPDLTARLRMRHTAERIYTGHGSHAEVRRAVEQSRAIGDPLVLAEALSLWHHTQLGPANTDVHRLHIADELIRVAAVATDEVLGLMGVLWRAVDLLLMGDQGADRALIEVRERADALQVAAVLFVLDAIDVMRLLRAGHIAAAEDAAQRCFELGTSIGDADAVGYLGGHLLTIRWLQMRPAEILPLARQVSQSPTLVDGDVAPRAAAAVLSAMLGDDDQARADLQHVMTRMPRNAETSSNWMISMFCAAETSMLLNDLKTAEAVYSSLLPYRHLPIMGSLAVVCLGSAERSLGIAARTLGDVNLAVHHFEQAIEHNHRLDNRVMVAISEGDLGCALIDRAGPGDIATGRVLVATAVRALAEFGLDERSGRLRANAAEQLLVAPVPDGELVRTGSTWRLGYGDHAVELADSIGVHRLAQLLQRPWTDLSASDLVSNIAPALRYDVNDMATLRSYRLRLDELHAEIDQADSDHDVERAGLLRAELDELLDHLGPTIGLHGRSRTFVDGAERARVAVRKSLGRVFDAVREQDVELAGQLDDSVRTGAICRFQPVSQFPSVWHCSSN